MIKTFRSCVIATVMTLVSLGAVSNVVFAEDAELTKAKEQYKKTYIEYIETLNRHQELDEGSAESAALESKLARISRELEKWVATIKKLGGTDAEITKIDEAAEEEVENRARVTATDEETGASVTKKVEPRCKRADDYVRALQKNKRWVGIVHLPVLGQKGQQDAAKWLRVTEKLLVVHLVACEDPWDRKKAVDWGTKRLALAKALIRFEEAFLFEYAPRPKIGSEEYDVRKESYANQKELRAARAAEQEAWQAYVDQLEVVEKFCLMAKWGGDPTAKLQCEQHQQILLDLYDTWEMKSNKVTAIRQPNMKMRDQSVAMRLERGSSLLKKYHPESQFTVHNIKELTALTRVGADGGVEATPLIRKLLGPEGVEILKIEGAMRRKATRR